MRRNKNFYMEFISMYQKKIKQDIKREIRKKYLVPKTYTKKIIWDLVSQIQNFLALKWIKSD